MAEQPQRWVPAEGDVAVPELIVLRLVDSHFDVGDECGIGEGRESIVGVAHEDESVGEGEATGREYSGAESDGLVDGAESVDDNGDVDAGREESREFDVVKVVDALVNDADYDYHEQ